MNIEKYPFTKTETGMEFEFLSIGINGNISKLVVYSPMELHNVFNLGFGDKDNSGAIDDIAITNNGDSERVLATVAATLLLFLEKFPDAIIFITGSTKSRTRLYQMGINSNLIDIQRNVEVYGLVGEKDWQLFEAGKIFEAFLVKRKIK